MKLSFYALPLCLLVCGPAVAQDSPVAPASSLHLNPEPYRGADYSGIYDCTGMDSHEGEYIGVVTLERVPSQSHGEYGAYRFLLEVPGYGAYPGQAASKGEQMGIFFANTDPAPKDYGTGIASFSKNNSGKWTFTKYYYQPEFKGGNFGTEACRQR